MCSCSALRFEDCVCEDKYVGVDCGVDVHGICIMCDSSFPCKCGHKSVASAKQTHQEDAVKFSVQQVEETIAKMQRLHGAFPKEVVAGIRAEAAKRTYAQWVHYCPLIRNVPEWLSKYMLEKKKEYEERDEKST